jgi:multidrug efflux system membrane fusion protein
MKANPMSVRALITLVLCGALTLMACQKSGAETKAGERKAPRAFPVEVVPVVVKQVDYTLSAVGALAAYEAVQVTARVAGVVEKVSFVEGTEVAAGTSLAEIETRRYTLALRAAQAQLARSQAALAAAQTGLERRESAAAASPGLIPGEEVDTYRTQVASARADISAGKVAVAKAALDLHDARVTAPIAGQIQSRSVQTGQYVQPGTVLATLVRRDPLLLRFSVAQQDAGRLRLGGPVSFTVPGGTGSYTAKITLIAAVADPITRMVGVTCEVDDARKAEVRAGAFAQVTVPVGEQPAADLVPQLAIRPSERGFLVYVVEGQVAHEKVVELGMRTADGMVEVTHGLSPGQLVVVRGGEALRDGAKVKVAGSGEGQPEGAAPGRAP